ncbi:MAG: hypothetical protein M1461_03900 [Nitrospirae bacterium]|nr:hypothetical protein [Nitrospirota bacterium]
MKTRTSTDEKKTKEVLSFIHLGFKDYIAARVLLNAGLCLQGTVLASTCVEKYFKSIIAFRGNTCKGHLKEEHLRSIKNYDPKLYASLNESFLLLLQKCYELRYLDALPLDFNLVIASRPILSELDFTIAEIHKRYEFIEGTKKIETAYDVAIRDNDPLLYLNHYMLQKIDKKDFIEQEDFVYEIRFDRKLSIFEAMYKTRKGKYEENFLREGLRPSSKGN